VRLVHPVESCAFGFAEGFGAPLAAVAPLFLTVDHDVALAHPSICPASRVVAESSGRVHTRLPLLLTSDTNKSAAGPALLSIRAHPRLPGVLPAQQPTHGVLGSARGHDSAHSRVEHGGKRIVEPGLVEVSVGVREVQDQQKETQRC
jgi:hypothetical protein